MLRLFLHLCTVQRTRMIGSPAMSERKALSLAALLTIGLSSTVSANPLASVNAYSCGNVPNPALNKLTVSAERPHLSFGQWDGRSGPLRRNGHR